MISRTTIQLTGHLARNESLKSLKPGALVNARILERLSPTEAKIDLKGSIVVARFEGGVPGGASVRLRLAESRGDMLVFKGEGGALPAGVAGTIAAPLAHYIAKNGSFPESIVQLMRSINGIKADDGREKRRDIAVRLVSAGFSARDTAAFSLALASSKEGGAQLLASLFAGPESTALESMMSDPRLEQTLSGEDVTLVIETLAGRREAPDFFIADGDSLTECFLFADENSLAVSFTLSEAGRIDILASLQNGGVHADLFVEQAHFYESLAFDEILASLRGRGIAAGIRPVLRSASASTLKPNRILDLKA